MEEKYDRIGVGYDRTRKADPYLVGRFVHHLSLRPGGRYLDIGCGTGNYTSALHELGVDIAGVDPSVEMLSKARSRRSAIEWRMGRVEDIPFGNGHFDGALAGLTVHHWGEREQGFSELGRVLRKGARLVIFTSTPAQMDRYWLHHYFPRMMRSSMSQMPAFEAIEEEARTGGFRIAATEKYFVSNDLKDLFLQSGKYNPTLYLDPQVRQGISSFAALAEPDELSHGLTQLARDIGNGMVHDVIHDYESSIGDYLFIVAEKG